MNSSDAEEEEDSDASEFDEFRELNIGKNGLTIADVLEQAKVQSDKHIKFDEKDAQVLICCGCLGDQSDGVNEIVECDRYIVQLRNKKKTSILYIYCWNKSSL